jgi:hypothetical protein
MTRFSRSLFYVPLAAAAVLVLGSCGGSPETASGGQADSGRTAAESRDPAKSNEPGPPDTYVPYRCSQCGCRVFMGDGAYCNRPSCEHRWTEHQRPPE